MSVAKEELRGPHPPALFGSGVGWQLCSRRHPSHLEQCRQKDERNQTPWSQSSPAVAELCRHQAKEASLPWEVCLYHQTISSCVLQRVCALSSAFPCYTLAVQSSADFTLLRK